MVLAAQLANAEALGLAGAARALPCRGQNGACCPQTIAAPQRAARTVARAGGAPMTYKGAGVDIGAGAELVRRIKKMNPSVGGFSGLFPFGGPLSEPGVRTHAAARRRCPVHRPGEHFLVAGTDGVGTKLKLAFDLGRHDTIGVDLVAMSVNDIITCGAKPLFFLDYYATSALDVDVAEKVRSRPSPRDALLPGALRGARLSHRVVRGLLTRRWLQA